MTTAERLDERSGHYELSHLRSLEAEAIHIIREVAAEFERPVLLVSGGKDSIVMLHLAVKAFKPGRLPFPVMQVATGHNFDEVIAFRDATVRMIWVSRVGSPSTACGWSWPRCRTTSMPAGWWRPSRRVTRCRP